METTIFLAIIRFIIEWTCVHPKSMELDFNSCSFNYKYDYTSRSSVGEPGIMIRVLKCSISNCNRVCIKMKHLKVVRQWCKKIEIGIFDKWLIPLIVSHMWHDQGKWVTCRKCQFLFSYTTFSKRQNGHVGGMTPNWVIVTSLKSIS